MIILIAESKTMAAGEIEVSPARLAAHTPCGEAVADEIMQSLKGLPLAELASQARLSSSLAARMQKMVYDFSFKSTGLEAIEAFTGVVFKSLDFASLSAQAKDRCLKNVASLSSLYGWLRPDDIIKPYRLDFNTRLEEGPSAGKALNIFQRPAATKALVGALNEQGQTEVLNLLPADAAACIDWKLVKRFARVWKVDFLEMKEGGVAKTPTANRLKTLRGTLLRQILEENIAEAGNLIHTVSPHYLCEGTPVYPDHLQFLC